jgi:hypothetical protein
MVADVSAREGKPVLAGASLARMRNLDLESRSAEAQRQLSEATTQAVKAGLHYSDLGAAEQERQRQITNNRLAQEHAAQLSVASPISGIVATAHLEDLVGRSLDEGDLILQVADTSEMKAQIYIPEFAMRDVHLQEKVRLLPAGQVVPLTGILSQLSASSTSIADGFVLKDQLQGINPPRYFVGTVLLKNNGELLLGAAGSAKVLVGRRSLAGFCLRFSRELVERKLW